jgi:hypothetical protein
VAGRSLVNYRWLLLGYFCCLSLCIHAVSIHHHEKCQISCLHPWYGLFLWRAPSFWLSHAFCSSIVLSVYVCSLFLVLHIFSILGCDCLCGLVVRVPGYISRGLGFDSWHHQIFWEVVSLEWGPLSLLSTIEELLGKKSSDLSLEIENTAVGIRCTDHATPFICGSWHELRRQAAVAWLV